MYISLRPCALTEHHTMKAYWGNGGIALRILDLGIRWRWVISFTPRPLYPQGKSPWYPLRRNWVGPRTGLNAVVRRIISSPYRDSNPPIIRPVAHLYTTELSQLLPICLRSTLIFSSHVRLGFSTDNFLSGIWAKMLYEFIFHARYKPIKSSSIYIY
jgi:hypothetical protein